MKDFILNNIAIRNKKRRDFSFKLIKRKEQEKKKIRNFFFVIRFLNLKKKKRKF